MRLSRPIAAIAICISLILSITSCKPRQIAQSRLQDSSPSSSHVGFATEADSAALSNLLKISAGTMAGMLSSSSHQFRFVVVKNAQGKLLGCLVSTLSPDQKASKIFRLKLDDSLDETMRQVVIKDGFNFYTQNISGTQPHTFFFLDVDPIAPNTAAFLVPLGFKALEKWSNDKGEHLNLFVASNVGQVSVPQNLKAELFSNELIQYKHIQVLNAAPVVPGKNARAFDVQPTAQEAKLLADHVFEDIRSDARMRIESNLLDLTTVDHAIGEELRVATESGRSVVLLGPGGVGKTTTLYQFILTKMDGKRVYSISASSIGAGEGLVGETEKKVLQIKEAANSGPGPLYLVVDNIHLVAGTGASANRKTDILDLIVDYVQSGKIILISASSKRSFDSAFAANPGVYGAFQQVVFPELSDERVGQIIKSHIQLLGMRVDDLDRFVARAVFLSNRLSAVGSQPNNALTIIKNLRTRKGEAETFGVEDLDGVAQKLFRPPPFVLNPSLKPQAVRDAESYINQNIVGGDTSFKSLLHEVARQAIAGLPTGDKPISSFAVLGPPGTGKTEGVKALAKSIGFGFHRINMALFPEPSESNIKTLLNAVRDAVRENPFSVILLDELEKASLKVQDALLEALDSGSYNAPGQAGQTTGTEERVVLKNAIIVATSNHAQEAPFRSTDEGYLRQALLLANRQSDRRISEPFLSRMEYVSGTTLIYDLETAQAIAVKTMLDIISGYKQDIQAPNIVAEDPEAIAKALIQKKWPNLGVTPIEESETWLGRLTWGLFRRKNITSVPPEGVSGRDIVNMVKKELKAGIAEVMLSEIEKLGACSVLHLKAEMFSQEGR